MERTLGRFIRQFWAGTASPLRRVSALSNPLATAVCRTPAFAANLHGAATQFLQRLPCVVLPKGRAVRPSVLARCAPLRCECAGGPCEPPARLTLCLLSVFCHRCRDLLFHGIEVEGCALLHGWIIDSGHDELCHFLLHKHEAPELVREPVHI